jgi:acetylglutamate kinase
MEVVEMVLCGKLNKKIASAINAAGGRAIGLSGKDDALVTASRKLEPDLGLVGEPQHVRSSLLHTLLDEGVVPVIAPIATGEGGCSYNVNADTMAGAIASSLGAQQLLLLTDVAGVLDGQGQLMAKLSTEDAERLTEDGTATGGMIPKLGTAIGAVHAGAGSAVIMDGRVPHSSLMHLFDEADVGTAVSDGA